jgi:16S rRNA (guanine966-N2)-methyltransferase
MDPSTKKEPLKFMLRLTAGIFRGRTLRTLAGSETRPTQAKLRQALFNSLQVDIPEARVLDLFAGSGALGFEALSRGAQSVVFVESSSAAVRVIRENAQSLGVLEQIQVIPIGIAMNDPAEKGSSRGALAKIVALQPFEVVLADPPYAEGWEEKLLNELPWEGLLTSGGKFCLEWGVQKSRVAQLPDQVPFLKKIREKEYGDSRLTHYQRD